MKVLQIFAIFFYFYLSKASESSEELKEVLSTSEGRNILKNELGKLYEQNSLWMIADWIHMVKSGGETINSTLVASQNVYNEDGTVKEVRFIELFLPDLEKKSAISKLKESTDGDDDDDDDLNINDMVKTFKELSSMGLEIEMSVAELDTTQYVPNKPTKKTNNMDSGFYINPEIIVVLDDGVLYLNKTIHAKNAQEVEEKIKSLQADQDRNLPISILKYNKEGKLMSEKSDIKPELLAYVKSMDGDVPDEIREEILRSLVKASLENPNDNNYVCKDVTTHLEQKFPNGRFLVLSEDVEGMYIKKDFAIEVAFTFTNLDEEDKPYKIYGILSK